MRVRGDGRADGRHFFDETFHLMNSNLNVHDPWFFLNAPLEAVKASAAAEWLHWHPEQLDECVRARGEHLPPALDERALEELREAHRRWGADETSLEAIDQLGAQETRVVITGQQPGLLAGPLLILYKAIACVRLAAELGERHRGLNFVPVFWAASEDHDFDEIRRLYWPSHVGSLEEYILASQMSVPGQMMGEIPSERMVEGLLERVDHSTHPTQFREEVVELIRAAYGEGQTIEAGFCRTLLRLLRGRGLVIVSPLMDWLRERSTPILRKELEAPGSSSRLILERSAEIEERGLEPALHRAPEMINVFWVDDEQRRHGLRLAEAGDGERVERTLAVRNAGDEAGTEIVGRGELIEALGRDPARLSTNAVSRVLVQDSVLPTVAQVVGPGEAAYLAQVETVYERFGVFAPVRWPRPQVTLIEPRVSRQLSKHELALEHALDRNEDELTEELIKRDLQQGILGQIEQIHHRHKEELYGVIEPLEQTPAIKTAADKLAQMMDKGYGKLVERVLYQQRQDEGHLHKAMATVANSLHPNSQPQERQLNPIVPFAVNYGLDWAGALCEQIRIRPGEKGQFIELAELISDREEE